LIDFSPEKKALVLGTALWGWGINRHGAYELLERFLEGGGSIIDTATNYPINKCEDNFGLARRWIADWIAIHGASNMSLIVKVGSVDNMGTPHNDLRPESIIRSANTLRDQFGDALSCLSIHWDDRASEKNQFHSIDQTVKVMSELEGSGLSIGMSGIKRPDLYYKAAPALSDKWIIQAKENVSTSLARETYQKFFPQARYLAYGINMGGVKVKPPQNNSSIELRGIDVPVSLVEKLSAFLNSDYSFEPRPTSLNELALACSYTNPALSGVIIGPRNIGQLVDTMKYWKKLKLSTTGVEGHKLFDRLVE